MKQILKVLAVHLVLTLFPVLVLSGIMACIKDEANAGGFVLRGIAYDITPDLSQENLGRLSASKSEEERVQAYIAMASRPVSGGVVLLRGETGMKQAVIDPDGKFWFDGLERASYTISATAPAPTAWKGIRPMASTHTSVMVERDCSVKLILQADLVTLKGHITDRDSHPIAGAKVTAEEVSEEDCGESSRNYSTLFSKPSSTTSNLDGSYELRGLKPTSLEHLGEYLNGGANAPVLRHYDIHVECDGFVQGTNNIPRVPQVTEEGVDSVRRLFTVLAPLYPPKDVRVKEGLSLPCSQGNTITGIDIVLTPKGEQ